MNWTPIRKIVVGGLTALVVYGAQRLGLDLGSDAVSDAIQGALPIVVAYATQDPRVKAVVADLDHSVLAAEVERIVLASLAERGVKF